MNRPVLFVSVALLAALFFGFNSSEKNASVSESELSNPNDLIKEEVAETVKNNIDDWILFSDEDYEFKYPKGLTVDNLAFSDKKNTRVKFFGPNQKNIKMDAFNTFSIDDGYVFWVAKIESNEDIDVENYAKKDANKHKEDCISENSSIADVVKSEIGKNESYSFLVKNCLGNYNLSYVKNGDSLYKISQFYIGDSKDKEREYFKNTSAILSTFEFTK